LKKCNEKCNHRAKNDSNDDAGNQRNCNQFLSRIHYLRHFGETKFHFLLVNLKDHSSAERMDWSGFRKMFCQFPSKYLFIAANA